MTVQLKITDEWRQRASAMKAAGASNRAIARATGVNSRTVDRQIRPEAPLPANIACMEPTNDSSFFERRQPRLVRQVLNRAAMPDALRQFARGEIKREELMKRISL